jgi:hypothetical protein
MNIKAGPTEGRVFSPILGKFYYFSHLKDRKIKIQKDSDNCFSKDTELCINLVERKNVERKKNIESAINAILV